MRFSRRQAFIYPGIAVLIFIFILALACSGDKKLKTYAALGDDVHYTGMEACRKCHTDKYETYIHTGMGMSFDIASRKKSSARFTQHDVIHDKYRNLSYHPHWEGDSLFITEFRLEGKDTTYKRKEKISYIIGSGQHTNSHMINHNGYVYQAPLTFYTQQSKWDLPPGFEDGFNSRFSRLIELECMSCHNAFPEIVKGSENKYTFIPNGIDCERCHGPGSAHVKDKESGVRTDITKDIDYSIVNPAKLPIDRQLDVCQRCHIQGNAVLNDNKSFFDFRPGMKLSDVMNVFMPVYRGSEDEHIMASHAERMKMSPCYTASLAIAEKKDNSSLTPYRNALTCVTCHDPHVSVTKTGAGVFNAACKNCHEKSGSNPVAKGSCTEKIETRKLAGDNCSGCHMKKNSTIDIPHVTSTDHWIRKPVAAKTVGEIKEFVGLACINNPDVDQKARAKAFLSYFEKFSSDTTMLDSARGYLRDGDMKELVSHFDDLVRWAFLKEDYEQVTRFCNEHPNALASVSEMSYSNNDAWTAYRIAESYNRIEDPVEAMRFMQRAVDLAPYDPDFRNKLAGLQHDSGKIKEAASNYEFIISRNAYHAPAFINYGFLVLKEFKDPLRADSLYNLALALDPDNQQALLNKAGVLIYMERNNEARKFLKRVISINPGNETARMLLNGLK